MYEYRIKLLRVVDGDTIQVEVDLGFNVIKKETLRLTGVNTPELHDSNPEVRKQAAQAQSYVEQVLNGSPTSLTVKTDKPYRTDKYGRWLARVYYVSPGELMPRCLNDDLVSEGLAKPFMTGSS